MSKPEGLTFGVLSLVALYFYFLSMTEACRILESSLFERSVLLVTSLSS